MTRSFVRALVCAALFALVLADPGLAAAQDATAPARRVLVLAPAGEARLARSIGAQARDRAIATLGARGFTAARGPAGCAEPDCATELLSGGAAEHALAIALWGRTRCDRVAVTLVDAQGITHSGEVAVTGTDVNAAIDGAIDAALAHLASGGSSTLHVTGAPEGATITLDQIPWGTLPHEDRVPHGEHQLAVSADGFVTDRRSVTVGTAPVSVEITLARAEVEAAPTPEPTPPTTVAVETPPPGGGPDIGLLAVGGGLAGVGVALLVVGSVTLALPDSGTPMPPDFTYERAALIDGIGWLVAGGVSAAAGIVLLVMGATSGSPAQAAQSRRGALFVF
jgi:hypothetical protein